MVQHPHPYTTLPLEGFDFKATTTYHIYVKVKKLERIYPEALSSFEGRVCIQFTHRLGVNKVKIVYPKYSHIPKSFSPRFFMLRVI